MEIQRSYWIYYQRDYIGILFAQGISTGKNWKKGLMKGEKKVCKIIVLIVVTEYDNVIRRKFQLRIRGIDES